MKWLAGLFVGVIAFVVAIPLVFANGGPSAAAPYACGQLGIILDTIRTLESGGDYTIHAPTSTASGAYQYINATWRHWAERAEISTDLYPVAADAPPHIQDQVAGVNVTSILADHDNNVEVIPIIWYLPSALDNPTLMDQVPGGGNVLTPREYQTKWLGIFNEKLAADADGGDGLCAGTDTTGEWALPAPRAAIDPSVIDDPHHTYPAWDFIIPTGTPIYAVTGGTVANTTTWGGNWWSAGCGGPHPPSGCSTCGTGVTIQHPDGLRHTYCHLSTLAVADGAHIAPGQYLGDSGNTGRSGTPHLHLEFRLNNIRRCPQPLLEALYQHTPIPTIAALPTSGCFFATSDTP